MIKTILVAVTGTERDAATLAAALAVARTFDAHLDVLHVRLDPVNIAVAMASDRPTAIVMTSPFAHTLAMAISNGVSGITIR